VTLVAHDLIGYDGDDYIRIVGGRALYESVMVPFDGYEGGNVRLARLDTTGGRLRQINRYVDPDTPVELVPTTTEETR
jgi:hypothetical protein